QTVAVLGGGVAGLTAANEPSERGFQVRVYERKPVTGGKARSIPVPNSGVDGRQPLLPRILQTRHRHHAPHSVWSSRQYISKPQRSHARPSGQNRSIRDPVGRAFSGYPARLSGFPYRTLYTDRGSAGRAVFFREPADDRCYKLRGNAVSRNSKISHGGISFRR